MAFFCLASPALAAPAQGFQPLGSHCQAGGNCWDGVLGGNCTVSCGCELGDGTVDANNSYCSPIE